VTGDNPLRLVRTWQSATLHVSKRPELMTAIERDDRERLTLRIEKSHAHAFGFQSRLGFQHLTSHLAAGYQSRLRRIAIPVPGMLMCKSSALALIAFMGRLSLAVMSVRLFPLVHIERKS
jgi:hypothetical protein